MPRLNWAPNPYAIAQLLTGRADIEALYRGGGTDADDFLQKAFKVREEWTVERAFAQFHDLAVKVDRPVSLADVTALRQVGEAESRYGVETIRRLLPLLVPIADSEFHLLMAPPDPRPVMPVVASYGEADELIVDQATYLDPIQGDVADCYLIASMIALAWVDTNLLHAGLNASGFDVDAGNPFRWQFHDDRGAMATRVEITSEIPMVGGLPCFARSVTPAEHWPSLVEKAYVVVAADPKVELNEEPTPANYQSIKNGATPQEACQALVGGVAQPESLDTIPGQNIFLPGGALHNPLGVMTRPVMAWTKENIGGSRPVWEKTGLWPNHAYAVLGVMGSGHIVLRNPHGIPTERRPGYSEDDEWIPPDGRGPVKLNQAGVFALSQDLFYAHFNNIGWVELN